MNVRGAKQPCWDCYIERWETKSSWHQLLIFTCRLWKFYNKGTWTYLNAIVKCLHLKQMKKSTTYLSTFHFLCLWILSYLNKVAFFALPWKASSRPALAHIPNIFFLRGTDLTPPGERSCPQVCMLRALNKHVFVLFYVYNIKYSFIWPVIQVRLCSRVGCQKCVKFSSDIAWVSKKG